jgi:hypothetical protein
MEAFGNEDFCDVLLPECGNTILMRVLTNDDDIKTTCSSRARLARCFGAAAPAVELAISTLKAARSLVEFLALPNVTKEDDVIFQATEAEVHLGLTEVFSPDDCVEMTSVRVAPPSNT